MVSVKKIALYTLLDTLGRRPYRLIMTQKKSVEVTVGQQRLSLKTDQDPALVQRVADLVNRRLADIVPPSQPVSHQVLLLLAMNLAQDLLQTQENGVKLKTEVRSRSQAILSQLEREFPV